MSEWIRKTIGELCDLGGGKVQTGPFGSQLHQSDYQEEGIPVVMPTNIVNGGIDVEKIARVSESHVERLYKHKLSKGDIIYGRRGDIGRQALVKNNNIGWLCGSGCLRISLGNCEVIPEYLHLYLQMPEIIQWILNQAIGATMPNLNTQILRRVPVDFPPTKEEQKKITSIVFAYNDLIENNERRIAFLENMAEEIYREWFVRFRFPGYQQAKFEKGIPVGWEVNKVKSMGKIVTGKTPSTQNSRFYDGEILFIKTPDMHGNMFTFHTEEKLTEEGLNSQPSQIISKNSICVSCIGTGGIVTITVTKCSTNQQINSVILKDADHREWGYFTLKNLKETIKAFGSTGTTMTNLSKGKFSNIKILVPSQKLIKDYSKITNSIFEQIKILMQSNLVIEKQKNQLLPRLISGKLSVENLDIQFPPSML